MPVRDNIQAHGLIPNGKLPLKRGTMKIRNQLNLSLIFFGLVLLGIFVALISGNQRVERVVRQEKLLRTIGLEAGGLGNLWNHYLLYPEKRQIDRWKLQYALLAADVAKLRVDRPEQQALIGDIKSGQQRLAEVFDDEMSQTRSGSPTRRNGPNPENIRSSWNRMEVQTRRIVLNISGLAQILHEQTEALKQRNNLLIAALMGVFSGFLLTHYLLIHRRLLKSVMNLRTGIKIIGSGNLDFTIAVKKGDEISELAQAFNQMTTNLKSATASKEDLEKEIHERQRAEAELLAIKEQLAAELAAVNRLHVISTSFGIDSGLDEILQEIVAAAVAFTHADMGHIQLADPRTGRLRIVAHQGFEQFFLDFIAAGAEANPYWSAAQKYGKRVIVADITQSSLLTGTPVHPVLMAAGVRAFQLTPLFSRSGGLLGIIATHYRTPCALAERDLQLLDLLARQIAEIIERVQSDEELLTSEREMLKVTLNSLGEGVVAADPETRIILINQTAAHLTGYAQAEAVGAPLAKVLRLVDDKTGAPFDPAAREVSGNPVLLTRDLRELPVAMICSPITTRDGRTIGTVIVMQDISEKQKIQRELSKADKLESLGILAGGIAHDFNNILGAILSNVQLAMVKMAKHQDIGKYLSNTVETTRKASDLTKQLLIFSRGGAPVRKDSSLNDLIKDTAEFALRGAKTKAAFTIPEDLWPASIDEGQISQVINNLVINAQQAMPGGGMIHLTAENVSVGKESRFKPGHYVKITLRDQGAGISKENLPKIFDPFFTTKKDGNGLGLATSYSIISHHDGYIDVESVEGMGTAFFIYLPASREVLASGESRKELAASGTGFKILLMDDEENILNAVGELLRHYGYQVALATNGEAVIEAYLEARDSGIPFDAVIMDLTVPGGMGGQEALTRLRRIDPNIKAIVSSGYANDPIMAEYERFDFVGVVVKPYKIDELHEVLLKVLNPGQLPLELGY